MSEYNSREAQSKNIVGTRVCPTCGISLSADISICPNDKTVLISDSVLGDKLSQQYEILEEIGSGGMGVIYKALHMALDQLVAIKMLQINRLDRVAVERFAQEAKAVNLLYHPNIVHIRDYGVTELGQPYMVLDYIDAVTLEESIAFKGACSVTESLVIFSQVADAIEHAHQHGILHRDLKPSNIMLVNTDSGSPLVKIVDFGIAKIVDQSQPGASNLTTTGEVFGSPAYMSPEQATGSRVDQRTDIYSLGCVMFETLTGSPPFSGPNAVQIISQHINDQAPTLKEGSLGKTFPQNVEEIVAKALCKDPADRFQSMAELKEALVIAQTGKKSIEKPTDEQIAKSKKKKLEGNLVQLSLLLFATSLCIIALFCWQQSHTKTITLSEDFHKTGTNAEILRLVEKYSSRTAIDLTGTNVTDEDLGAFANCYLTKKLTLNETTIEGPGLAYLVHLPLIELNLIDSDLKDEGLKNIAHMTSLQDLNLEKTHITDAGLPELTPLRNLVYLHLDENNVTAKGLAYLKTLPALKALTLRHIKCDWSAALREIAQYPALKNLDLSDTNVSDDNMLAVSKCKHLYDLQLGFSGITAKGVAKLADAPSLRVLSLQNNRHFDNTDFTVFENVKVNHLDLRGLKINEQFLPNLEKTSINGLNLEGAQVSKKCLDVLAKNHRIIWLILNNPEGWQDAIQEFKKKRPDCKVE